MQAMPEAQCQNQEANKLNQGHENSVALKWLKSQVKAPNQTSFSSRSLEITMKGKEPRAVLHVTILNASRQLPLFGMIHVGTSSVLASFEQPDRRVWRTKNILLYTKAQ